MTITIVGEAKQLLFECRQRKRIGEHICYMEDVKANAIGYEFITAAMYRR